MSIGELINICFCKLGIYLIYTWINWEKRVFRDGFLWKCPMADLAWVEVVSDMIQGFPPTTIKLQERWKKRHIRTAICFLFLRNNSENWLILQKFQNIWKKSFTLNVIWYSVLSKYKNILGKYYDYIRNYLMFFSELKD